MAREGHQCLSGPCCQELRKRATRNTAVVIHEIRQTAQSRKPIIRIGARHAFSDDGVVPVSSHPSQFWRGAAIQAGDDAGLAAVALAALFHDLGKATTLFQSKLRRALDGGAPEADAVRHELFSAAVWDALFGESEDADLSTHLATLTPERIDQACVAVRKPLQAIHSAPQSALGFRFVARPGSLSHLIGMLILTHHRLPEGENDHVTMLGARHVRTESPLDRDTDLAIAAGTPFWHEHWWLAALGSQARALTAPHARAHASADIALRASLMFADHLGSAKKAVQTSLPDHLANTKKPDAHSAYAPADSVSRHVKRVFRYARFAHDMTHRLRDRYPALNEPELPTDIACPDVSTNPRFAWQGEAAHAARAMCERHEGGFFAAILAGTGTGKTRGAPTILAGAALGDTRPERRYFRMSLGLGLRVLATQSAAEYVEDLGFSSTDVSVLIGDPPLDFDTGTDATSPPPDDGSESLIHLPPWLRVESPNTRIPEFASDGEAQWLRGLSLDTGRRLPAFLDEVLEHAGKHQASAKRLIQAPIMVGTIDHLMGIAAPTNARYLIQSLRVMTSDLILDEIDQYDAEDLAAIARLVFQVGALGRRIVLMSATLPADIAETFHTAYCRGWSEYARAHNRADHVNLLICGDAPGSVFTNVDGGTLPDILGRCQDTIRNALRSAPPLRPAEILAPCDTWRDLVGQIDAGCSRLHDRNAIEIDGHRVSVGMIRMTRISHTTALAVQLPSGPVGNRLRLIVCLHAQMPRLHRGYIESRLKRALTRKAPHDPNIGVRTLCADTGVFARAAAIGTRDVEIVIVTTPVIETGNDLDFDWAILDPVSTRSVIQSAGRVCRHRPASGKAPNTLVLGRSPIAMQQGELAMPGVETTPAKPTGVPKVETLLPFVGRHFSDLAGKADFTAITAMPLLCTDVPFPLRDAETWLRGKMISLDQRDPLGRYIYCPNARWTLAMTRSRKFRRSDTRDIELRFIGATLGAAKWFINLAPGTKSSRFTEMGEDLSFGPETPPGALFETLTESGWHALQGGHREMAAADISSLLRVGFSTYGDDLCCALTYSDFTGFTRGTPDDLLQDFGKSAKVQ